MVDHDDTDPAICDPQCCALAFAVTISTKPGGTPNQITELHKPCTGKIAPLGVQGSGSLQLGTPNCHVSRLRILHSLAQVKLVEGERGGHEENFQASMFLMFLGVWVWEWNLNEP